MTERELMGAHRHSRRRANLTRAFGVGIALNAGFVLAEAGAGFLANSLALLADAGHNLGDVMGLLLAWGADRLSRRRSTLRRSYGLRKSSVLAALVNAIILLATVGAIAWEAVRRLWSPSSVHAETVVCVAAVGVGINLGTALLFLREKQDDLNIRGAFLHMAADAALSAGVVGAGVLISLTGQTWIDPVVSLSVAAAIFVSAWGILRESLNLALDAVPVGVDTAAIHAFIAGLPGVKGVHDLHVWALSTVDVALTVHVVLERPVLDNALLVYIRRELHDRYGITHPTVQFESSENEICTEKQCSLDACSTGGAVPLEPNRRH